MSPTTFPEANCCYGAPEGMAESQVMTIPAFTHQVQGGSCDGSLQVVVAWQPSPEELTVLNAGGPLYISMLGGLAPHYPSVDFHAATHPA
jgi:hypothetical protein